MRIVHLDLAGFYTENTNYQTNMLSEMNSLDGHETTVISTTYHFDQGVLTYTPVCDKLLHENLRLIRLRYVNPSKNFLHQKIRKVKGLFSVLEGLKPDVIMCHCTQFWSILDVIRYKKKYPATIFYADEHASYKNSGKNWISLYIQHRILYRWLTKKAVPYLEKCFYISKAEKQFAIENYNVPEDIMEFYPLGGILFTQEEYAAKRRVCRQELEIENDELLIVHSGKLDFLKNTESLLRAFAAVPELNARLVVLGHIPEDMVPILTPLIEADPRVMYLGWKSTAELQKYLCGCDLYAQPGSVSATMQNAVCCGCPILSYPHEEYVADFDFGNIIWTKDTEEIMQAFKQLASGELDLLHLKEESVRCARELLDYHKLAARLYQ